MRVLLVEDDESLGDAVATGLRLEDLAVDWAQTIAEAEDFLVSTAYDVVCLDLGLPDGDGFDLCRRMQDGDVVKPRRLLMLTARDGIEHRVAGLDAGADDYLVKPFKLAELAARIRALVRRSDQVGSVLVVGELHIDVAARSVRHGSDEIRLTSREFSVLHYLAAHPGELVSAERLLEHCWDAHADDLTSSVKVIVSRVRKKLGSTGTITTVRNGGYRLDGR